MNFPTVGTPATYPTRNAPSVLNHKFTALQKGSTRRPQRLRGGRRKDFTSKSRRAQSEVLRALRAGFLALCGFVVRPDCCALSVTSAPSALNLPSLMVRTSESG